MIDRRSLVEVGVAMVLRDRFSNEAGRISNSFRTMMNDMNTWNRGIQMSTSNAFEFGKNWLEVWQGPTNILQEYTTKYS